MRSPFKKALITGGAGELAGALCRELLAEGTALVLIDRDLAALEARVASLGAPERCTCYEADLSDFEAIEVLLQDIVALHADLDLLILNAGIDRPQSIDHFDWRIAKQHLDINTIANYVALAVFLPWFKQKNSGHVVGIVSLGALCGLPCEHAYNASKAAFSMMLDGLRAELRGTGVTFTSVYPGYLQGSMIAGNAFKVGRASTMPYAAKRIMAAVHRRQPRLRFPVAMLLQVWIGRMLPVAILDRIAAANITPPKT